VVTLHCTLYSKTNTSCYKSPITITHTHAHACTHINTHTFYGDFPLTLFLYCTNCILYPLSLNLKKTFCIFTFLKNITQYDLKGNSDVPIFVGTFCLHNVGFTRPHTHTRFKRNVSLRSRSPAQMD